MLLVALANEVEAQFLLEELLLENEKFLLDLRLSLCQSFHFVKLLH